MDISQLTVLLTAYSEQKSRSWNVFRLFRKQPAVHRQFALSLLKDLGLGEDHKNALIILNNLNHPLFKYHKAIQKASFDALSSYTPITAQNDIEIRNLIKNKRKETRRVWWLFFASVFTFSSTVRNNLEKVKKAIELNFAKHKDSGDNPSRSPSPRQPKPGSSDVKHAAKPAGAAPLTSPPRAVVGAGAAPLTSPPRAVVGAGAPLPPPPPPPGTKGSVPPPPPPPPPRAPGSVPPAPPPPPPPRAPGSVPPPPPPAVVGAGAPLPPPPPPGANVVPKAAPKPVPVAPGAPDSAAIAGGLAGLKKVVRTEKPEEHGSSVAAPGAPVDESSLAALAAKGRARLRSSAARTSATVNEPVAAEGVTAMFGVTLVKTTLRSRA